MYPIDGPGAVDGQFTDGSPSTGQEATMVTAAWLNRIQEELLAIVLAAGITPDSEDNAQVLAAISSVLGDYVDLTNPQTVAGIKTFSAIPVLPASNPTTDNQAARKAYVDAARADALQTPSGIIEGMQISRSGVNQLRIAPGTIQILGERYHLTSAFTLTVGTSSSFGWNAVRVAKPTSGRELALFGTCPVGNIVRGSSNVWWHVDHADDWLVLGLYPYADSDVIEGFETVDGLYICRRNMIEDNTPPTKGISDPDPGVSYAIGLPPIGEDVMGFFQVHVSVNNAYGVTFGSGSDGHLSTLSAYVGGSLGTRWVWGPVHIISADGTATLHVSTEGTSNYMHVQLYACTIPSGMAR